ncbi:MAG: recombination regulator RecX, partial [Lachnospiraceae bacterium]|nr:recombination regulator RecX [Lachnospiraceae bacterium]
MEQDCVAQIRKLSGGRYLVTLESGASFPLYGGELSECHIREGEEVSGAVLDQILGDLLPKRARLRAMHLLEKMDRTEAQLREKLRQSFYPDEVVEDAIGYVKGFRYIDDLRYARSYLETHSSQKSLRQMEQELFAKGIDRETVRPPQQ